MKEKEKFMSDIDLNKSSKACSPCSLECEKINKRINDRKLTEIETKEVPHLLKVFDFWFSDRSPCSLDWFFLPKAWTLK